MIAAAAAAAATVAAINGTAAANGTNAALEELGDGAVAERVADAPVAFDGDGAAFGVDIAAVDEDSSAIEGVAGEGAALRRAAVASNDASVALKRDGAAFDADFGTLDVDGTAVDSVGETGGGHGTAESALDLVAAAT